MTEPFDQRPSRIRVDLGAIAHNLRAIRAHVGVPVMGIVKANAYGHGLVPVARHLVAQGVDQLGVAFVEEGIALRNAGIRLPIRQIAAALRALPEPPLLVVDGVHGIGAADETIATMGADYFCAGTHKWMFAPRGTGLVWANAANWARLQPIVPNFTELESYVAWTEDRAPAGPSNAARVSPGGFHAFEHQWAMAAAFRMHMKMDRARVAARRRRPRCGRWGSGLARAAGANRRGAAAGAGSCARRAGGACGRPAGGRAARPPTAPAR